MATLTMTLHQLADADQVMCKLTWSPLKFSRKRQVTVTSAIAWAMLLGLNRLSREAKYSATSGLRIISAVLAEMSPYMQYLVTRQGQEMVGGRPCSNMWLLR